MVFGYFLPFLNYFWIMAHSDVVNVSQVFCSFTLSQCSLDQPTAERRAVFLSLGQSSPRVLHAALGEGELWSVLCLQRD